MSLIIAKKRNNQICIVSDTKLTDYPISMHPKREVASPMDSVIKCTILNKHLCIAVAGCMEGVDGILKKCRKHSHDLHGILDILLKFNQIWNGRTTFIVGVSLHPVYEIFEIKDSFVRETNDAWIGRIAGFNEFQKCKTALSESHPEFEFQYVMEKAMKQIIENGIDPTISGYVISVTNDTGGFTYKSRMEIDITERILPLGYSVIGHGTAQEGAYSIHFFPSNPTYSAFAIHILQGNFGVVYSLNENAGLLYPTVISEVDEEEFAEIVYQKHGIVKDVSVPVSPESYFKRGNKAFEQQNYAKSLELYNKCLTFEEYSQKGALFFNRGIVLSYLDRQSEALKDFKEAVRINSSFQAQILKFLQSQKKRRI